MSFPGRAAPRHTGLAIAGLVAIPFASVTTAAWLGDAASSADARDAIGGSIALVGGVVMGLLVRRLIASVDRHLRGMARVVASMSMLPGTVLDRAAVVTRLILVTAVVPAVAFVPAGVGRRGPPIRVR